MDYVSESGRIAARGAVKYIQGLQVADEYVPVEMGEHIRVVVPQQVRKGTQEKTRFFMRVTEPLDGGVLRVSCNGKEVYR